MRTMEPGRGHNRREFLGTLAAGLASAMLPKETEARSKEEQPNVKESLEKLLEAYEGKARVVQLEGNGNREVVLYAPKGFDPSVGIELIYHFHGTNGQLIDQEVPYMEEASKSYKRKVGKLSVASDRLKQVLESLDSREKKNAVVAYPISAGRRAERNSTAYRNGYDNEWMNPEKTEESMEDLHAQVIDQLSNMYQDDILVNTITLKGHSAGGKALMNVAVSSFSADRIDFLDASYGTWARVCYDAAYENNPDVEMNIIVRPGTSTERAARQVEGRDNVLLVRTHVPHGEMNSNFFNYDAQ